MGPPATTTAPTARFAQGLYTGRSIFLCTRTSVARVQTGRLKTLAAWGPRPETASGVTPRLRSAGCRGRRVCGLWRVGEAGSQVVGVEVVGIGVCGLWVGGCGFVPLRIPPPTPATTNSRTVQ